MVKTKQIPSTLPEIELDSQAINEELAISNQSLDLLQQEQELDALVQLNKNTRKNRKLRSKYAKWVFRYLIGYSAIVGMMLVGSGFSNIPFSLSDGVLEILVGSTAVSAIGLVLAVTHGLFKNLDNK